MSDSTSITAHTPTGREVDVGATLAELVESATGAVVVGLFSSNVHRLRALGEIAERTDRILVPLGRSLRRHGEVAERTCYLHWSRQRVVSEESLAEHANPIPKHRLLC